MMYSWTLTMSVIGLCIYAGACVICSLLAWSCTCGFRLPVVVFLHVLIHTCVFSLAVGHCHHRVVKAGVEQMATLNINSRYLDDLAVKYAKHLTKTLPDNLSCCLFFSSGWVATIGAACDLLVEPSRSLLLKWWMHDYDKQSTCYSFKQRYSCILTLRCFDLV